MKWKKEEDCDCCWAITDPKSSELLSRITAEPGGNFVARVFIALGQYKTRKDAQIATEKFLKQIDKVKK